LGSRCSLRWLPASSAHAYALLQDPRVLGAVQFGSHEVDCAWAPIARLANPLLGAERAALEIWAGAAAAETVTVPTKTAGPVQLRHNNELLFGAIAAPLADVGDAAYAAYRSMLDCLRETAYPYPLRIWNSIPDMNAEDAGLERYRRFNLQRFRAFEEAQLATHSGAPAASALGTLGGPLTVHFLAAREPPIAIENPRQISAYHYPNQYGPRAPNFSRAALWRGAGGDMLFVSGTSSIVGHETRHRGDPAAQTRETIANLSAVLEQLARISRPLALGDLALKAYVRHPAHLPAVRAALAEEGVAVEQVLFLQADICRADLLVEIEATGPAAAMQFSAERAA
jgi:enamine deaminase RidA (YjgF/YER057c/UK114 family)